MSSGSWNLDREKIVSVVVFAGILLTSSWFIGIPENKNDDLANNRADFTLNSKPKISLLFPEGDAPKTFIEPISPKISQESDLAVKPPSEKLKTNPANLGPGMTIYLPQIFEKSPKLEANQLINVKMLNPKSMAGVEELLQLLRGFGDFINVPKDQLTIEFARRDKAIIQKTKELYGNPSHFVLGEQCGGLGAAETYPPGSTTNTACGGDPEYSYPNAYYSGGGGACNTDPPCFGTGFCFEECYDYELGGYCYCWVPSCLGVCGFQSYIWDSVTGTCGCGALGSEGGDSGE